MTLILSIPTVSYAVEVFDGSTIIIPIVEFNLFWYDLQNKLIALLVAQDIAIIIFGIIATCTSSFMIKLLISKDTNNTNNDFIWNVNKNVDNEMTNNNGIDTINNNTGSIKPTQQQDVLIWYHYQYVL